MDVQGQIGEYTPTNVTWMHQCTASMCLVVKKIINWKLILLFIWLGAVSFRASGTPSWNDEEGGATRDFYHKAARMAWQNKPADWLDHDGAFSGRVPWGAASVTRSILPSTLKVDVTAAVNAWLTGLYPNEGFLLLLDSPSGPLLVSSRESGWITAPRLFVRGEDYSQILYADYDTYLDRSTGRSLGSREFVKISGEMPALVWFDLEKIEQPENVSSASIVLDATKLYGSGDTAINVYMTSPGGAPAAKDRVESGIASQFTRDRGLASHASVLYAENFEEKTWRSVWTDGGRMGEVITIDDRNGFASLDGAALKATLPKGKLTGLNQRYQFRKNSLSEPEAAYFRYYLRLGDDWDQTVSGGKLPGFAGTYNRAGWGSRKPDGSNGWSARGAFYKSYSASGSPEQRITPIGSYVYHLDQGGYYGSNWGWGIGGGAQLEKNRWYCIEQYLSLNTPGKKDGMMKAWVDGRLVFEKTGLRFRTTPNLRIEEVWLDFYHGGTTPSPHTQSLYIDNFVIATEYIGPMRR